MSNMAKRLQVLLAPQEYKSFQQMAREAGLSLGAWVRKALRQMADSSSTRSPHKKIQAIRSFSKLNYPSGDIDQILSEIEKSYA
jgi:hypothetical protein